MYLPQGLREVKEPNGCSTCQEETCPPLPHMCWASRVRDPCGCCWKCANVEGQRCDLPGGIYQFGECGDGLLCHEETRRCICETQEKVCGTDRRTYKNVCRLKEAARYKWKRSLKTYQPGPCPWEQERAPIFITPPRDTLAIAGQGIILGCVVSAHPVARIQWRKEGTEEPLPGGSSNMIVQTHEGPHRHQVAGWLQIHPLGEADEGQYVCVAWNKFGSISASATLSISRPDTLFAAGEYGLHAAGFDLSDDEDAQDRSQDGPSGSDV
ncbi:kazal-type serine protease inhibitor domain-containing protein 1-like [Spea bombifrons]|uniref:kazal-type serine protease inhibitor domain-containing protein 1-like n=1 Tax=Spea bombifrons TaxID=233779 RepID=UPI00234BE82B|nr:kazal-type serine protease inhibitor domain-containing protein 1-like [Spea bombifrons]